MIEHFKRLSKQTIIYGLGDAVIKAINFFLIPLYTRLLTKEQVGDIALLNYVELILILVLSLGLNSAVLKVFHDYKTAAEKRSVFSTAFIFTAFIALIILTILFFNVEILSTIIFRSTKGAIFLKFIIGSSLFNIFRLLALSYYRALEKPLYYSILNILHFITLVGLNIYHVLVLKQAVLGVVKSSLYTSIFLFAIVTIIVFSKIGLSFSREILNQLLEFGLPIMPGTVANWMLTISDRYLLNWFSDTAEVGLYDIAYKFGMIINMVLVMPFRTAWLPFVFSIQKREEANKIYSGALTYFLLIATFLFLFLALFAREIIIVVSTPDYLPGVKAIPLIALAYIFFGLYYIVDIGILLKVKTIYYTIITGIGAAVNIGLNLLLIPKYGMMAAAINSTIAYFLLFILMLIISKKFYSVAYEKLRILKIISIGMTIYLIGTLISFDSIILSIFFKIVLLISFPFLLYLLNFFRATELAGYRKIISETLNSKRRLLHGEKKEEKKTNL